MKSKYREVQNKGIIVTALLVIMVLLLLTYRFQWASLPMPFETFILFFATFCLILLLFYQMKTEIDDQEIQLSFGIGLIKKHIDLSKIQSVEVVRNKWYVGWGIRYYGKGWMWNYSGLDAVELKYKDSQKHFRIGSSNPSELKEIIEKMI